MTVLTNSEYQIHQCDLESSEAPAILLEHLMLGYLSRIHSQIQERAAFRSLSYFAQSTTLGTAFQTNLWLAVLLRI
jgi:hypothetical protein